MKGKQEFVEFRLLLPNALASKLNAIQSDEMFNITFYLQLCFERFGTDFLEIIRKIAHEKSLDFTDINRAIQREASIKRAPKKGGPTNWVAFYTRIISESSTIKDKVWQFEKANEKLLKRSRQRLRKNLRESNELEEIEKFIKERDEREYEEKKELYHALYLMDELTKKAEAEKLREI